MKSINSAENLANRTRRVALTCKNESALVHVLICGGKLIIKINVNASRDK